MNKVILIGNVGFVKGRTAANNLFVLNFSVATTYGSGEKKKTSWHNCVLFGDYAHTMSTMMTKGQKVGVEGELNYSEYNNKEGVKIVKAQIIARSVEILSKKGESHDQTETMAPTPIIANEQFTEDDIPF